MNTTVETFTEIEHAIDTIRLAVANTPMDDATAVDMAGELRSVANRVTAMARNIESEIPDDAVIAGSRWQTKVGRSASRTYNESAILAALSTAYGTTSIGDVLHAAANDGAIKLSWSWTAIRKLFDQLNIPLTTVPHEVGDGQVETSVDGEVVVPHVGEVWKWRTTFEPVDDGNE